MLEFRWFFDYGYKTLDLYAGTSLEELIQCGSKSYWNFFYVSSAWWWLSRGCRILPSLKIWRRWCEKCWISRMIPCVNLDLSWCLQGLLSCISVKYDGVVKSPSAALRSPWKTSTYKKYALGLSRLTRLAYGTFYEPVDSVLNRIVRHYIGSQVTHAVKINNVQIMATNV